MTPPQNTKPHKKYVGLVTVDRAGGGGMRRAWARESGGVANGTPQFELENWV